MIESNGNALFFDDGKGRGESVLNSVAMLGSLDVKHDSRPRRDRISGSRGMMGAAPPRLNLGSILSVCTSAGIATVAAVPRILR